MARLNPFLSDGDEDPLDRLPPIGALGDEDLAEAESRMAGEVIEGVAGMSSEGSIDFDIEEEPQASQEAPMGDVPVNDDPAGAEADESAMADLESEFIDEVDTSPPPSADVEVSQGSMASGADLMAEALDGDPLFNNKIAEKIDQQMNERVDARRDEEVASRQLEQLVGNAIHSELGGLITFRPPLRHGQGVG